MSDQDEGAPPDGAKKPRRRVRLWVHEDKAVGGWSLAFPILRAGDIFTLEEADGSPVLLGGSETMIALSDPYKKNGTWTVDAQPWSPGPAPVPVGELPAPEGEER